MLVYILSQKYKLLEDGMHIGYLSLYWLSMVLDNQNLECIFFKLK